MIIIINGSHGVGKTTICNELIKRINNKQWIFLKSDYYWIRMLKTNMCLSFGGTIPSTNNNFLNYYRKEILNTIQQKNVIIDLTINNDFAKKEIINHPLLKKEKILHFIIKSSQEIVLERIKNDNRDDEELPKKYNENMDYFNENFKNAIYIDTSNKTVEECALEIYKNIKEINIKGDIYIK